MDHPMDMNDMAVFTKNNYSMQKWYKKFSTLYK